MQKTLQEFFLEIDLAVPFSEISLENPAEVLPEIAQQLLQIFI